VHRWMRLRGLLLRRVCCSWAAARRLSTLTQQHSQPSRVVQLATPRSRRVRPTGPSVASGALAWRCRCRRLRPLRAWASAAERCSPGRCAVASRQTRSSRP
jgi:hypothetical protein